MYTLGYFVEILHEELWLCAKSYLFEMVLKFICNGVIFQIAISCYQIVILFGIE